MSAQGAVRRNQVLDTSCGPANVPQGVLVHHSKTQVHGSHPR
jgi:hypothetical protein